MRRAASIARPDACLQRKPGTPELCARTVQHEGPHVAPNGTVWNTDEMRMDALERLLRDHHFHVMFTEEGFDVFHGAATEEEPLPTLREAIDRAMARVA